MREVSAFYLLLHLQTQDKLCILNRIDCGNDVHIRKSLMIFLSYDRIELVFLLSVFSVLVVYGSSVQCHHSASQP